MTQPEKKRNSQFANKKPVGKFQELPTGFYFSYGFPRQRRYIPCTSSKTFSISFSGAPVARLTTTMAIEAAIKAGSSS